MSNRNLSKPLFHGTTANLKEGDIIKPSKDYFSDAKVAFATDQYPEAYSYAHARAKSRGALFGSVYEVEPLEGDKTLQKKKSLTGSDQRRKSVRTSEKGFRVVRHVGWSK
jgi:hypothetical protein